MHLQTKSRPARRAPSRRPPTRRPARPMWAPVAARADTPGRAAAMIGLAALRVYSTVFFVASGAAFALGPPQWRSSASYVVVREWMPLRAWGAMLAACGVVHLATLAVPRWRTSLGAAAAAFAGGVLAAAWAVALIDTAILRRLPGLVGAMLWGLLVVVEFVVGENLLRRGR